MAAKKKRTQKKLSAEDQKMHEHWVTLAACLGYNELAKLAKTLGEKLYFRLMRDQAVQRYVKVGGNDNLFATEPGTIEICVPYANAPSIKLRPTDYELMRDALYRHDCEQRKCSTSAPVKP